MLPDRIFPESSTVSRVDASGRPANENVSAIVYTSVTSEKVLFPPRPADPVRYTLNATPTVRMRNDVAASVSVFMRSRFVFFIFASEKSKSVKSLDKNASECDNIE